MEISPQLAAWLDSNPWVRDKEFAPILKHGRVVGVRVVFEGPKLNRWQKMLRLVMGRLR